MMPIQMVKSYNPGSPDAALSVPKCGKMCVFSLIIKCGYDINAGVKCELQPKLPVSSLAGKVMPIQMVSYNPGSLDTALGVLKCGKMCVRFPNYRMRV